ncbi:uncharacterized protein LOC110462379 [Mizuhopecten yessoensis]|uniref:Uncharacterized protein n=1 Tax=Mizuhopecten yessoensis TaxID=6573 RepID=A0A210PY77_MIZYE|nr:uncharacterized protein LOC110462379 [Mizuhopecten yessoensis]OWF41448.1 hypothetical protein KP79_PYT21811 [Mizuhopecten yessoensis]
MMGALLNTIFAIFISLTLIGEKLSTAAPMSQFIPESSDITDPDVQSLLVNQELKRQMLQNWQSEKESSDTDGPYARSGLKRLLAQRRLAEQQKRSGRGGVALCLWKVCPAGPWLVSQK